VRDTGTDSSGDAASWKKTARADEGSARPNGALSMVEAISKPGPLFVAAQDSRQVADG
jgi:hypothetical protein